MTILKQLNKAVNQLKTISSSPNLDAEILLSYAINKPKEYLYAHPEKELTELQTKKIQKYIKRRKNYEPVAYITEKKEFYGLTFKVNKNTLIPRPETELMVEEVINIVKASETSERNKILIIDVGTGSGCIAISLAKNLKRICGQIFAIDISKKALNIAKYNAAKNKISANKIKFLHGDLLKPIKTVLKKSSNIIITANLPYLSDNIYKNTSPEIRKYESPQALIAGKDGLKYYKKLFPQIKKFLPKQELSILCEIDPSQTKAITALARKHFTSPEIEIKKDLAGLNRLVIIKAIH
ncbi:peptide chain release factor N(5)-glutamine methyltransferase [Patescibacteria group bacterium]